MVETREIADVKAVIPVMEQIAALKAENERLTKERDAARRANECDRTEVIIAVNALTDAFARRDWLIRGGRGSYEWDDDRFRDEFRDAMAEFEPHVDRLRKIGADRANCPETQVEVLAARAALAERAGGMKELREAALILLSEIDSPGNVNSIVGASNPLRKALHALAIEPAEPIELSGITRELRDKVAEAIRGDGSDLDDTPWETLSDERKIGWLGDADRALAVVKDYLTSRPAPQEAEAVKATEKTCAICGDPSDNDLLSDMCVSCEVEAPWREDASHPAQAVTEALERIRDYADKPHADRYVIRSMAEKALTAAQEAGR